MAYTTAARVKEALTYEYWVLVTNRLTEDGWAFTLDPNSFTDEADFLNSFIDRCATFIDDYIGNGPFEANGMLENINRWLAIYDVEQYLLAGTSDRVVSVTINEDKKRALRLLDRIVDEDSTLSVTPTDVTNTSMTPQLIESDNDGVTLTLGALEEDIILGGAADAEEIPE